MDRTYQWYHYALSFTGVYIFSDRKWDSYLKTVHQVLNFLVVSLVVVFTTVFIITSSGETVVLMEGISIWITGVVSYLSITITLIFRKQFRAFLEEMVFKDAILELPFINHVLTNSRKGVSEQLKVLVLNSQKKLLKYCDLLLKAYLSAAFVTIGLYVAGVVFQLATYRGDDLLRILVFQMWIPWKIENWNFYIPTLIWNSYAGFLCAMVHPTTQCTIVLLVGQIIRQLRILTFILKHLDELVLEITKERDERWQQCCTSILAQCIDYFVKIKRFSNRLNTICRPFYLALILNATFLVCVRSVTIALSNTLSPDLIKYLIHELVYIQQVFMFCYLGQQIYNECENLENALTEKWYIFDKGHKKNVQIFGMALRQNMPVYIFGTIPLYLPTFTWFIKTGMSFFTLVMSVLEE